ncbi:hypothetical protein BT96DRAFT_240975 [Gymnopus androsaceus JB14]|uniref:Uncharacterized protein n=1 Tax=Gymnopus androsaceus JB14 TaxID=1447944 RepID=A0A6A4IEX5_9AGAR|nr:hypothetical protein BT96DRAFT_240975 [Gymnopus androsaceus JB14]
MSVDPAIVYTASMNPSRRVKASRTLLPRQTSVPAEQAATVTSAEPPTSSAAPPPAKRGRKPGSGSNSGSGGLSRTARETQRKLNHSIIEKARRTKINEALAELARLGDLIIGKGPSDPDPAKPGDEDDEVDVEDEDDDDKDGDYGSASSRTRTRTKSKTASTSDSTNSKGKDKFKLDILVKTVENMQILLDKVGRLEAELKDAKAVECSKCIASELAGPEMDVATTKNKRKRHAETVANTEEDQRRRRVALPSISSWLPDSHSSPDAFTSHPGRSPFGTLSPRTIPFDTQMRLPASYLPSPPSSTQFAPSVLTSSGAMPVLELGPSSVPGAFNSAPPSSVPPSADSASMFPAFRERSGSTTSTSTSGRDKIPFTARTPEDESAASLLLHISSSPPVFTTARTRKNSMLERVEPMSTPMPMSIAPQPVSTDSLNWREEKEDPSLNADGHRFESLSSTGGCHCADPELDVGTRQLRF